MSGIEPTLMSAVYEECRQILGNNPAVSDVREAVALAVATAERVWGDLQDESPAYACRKGCAWCCHQTVMVIAPEVIFVADHIFRSFEIPEREALRVRLGRQSNLIEGKTTAERQTNGFPCGALADFICSVHLARPLPCRGGYSSDAEFCRDLFEDFAGINAALDRGVREEPFLTVPKILFSSAQLGLARAFQDIGYRCQPLELTAALEIALSLRDVGEAWLEDEDVFLPAVLRKVGDYYVTSAS
ncbi:MAG: hypothetical protein CFH10_00901 [Alphaproteobacteria bacterium MarineAlpha4_Bin2]|nr:MAG: hypothetical protein CFH10_00901 [Alphaproteobacteria bacterium MarineAlpha4_Bin2]|tara:strand:- start:388 stop:1122 length:735 start_codon:yes stop_codon:yes gene_type:complete